MSIPIPTGTVTFLFTDIEGSTKNAQEYPDRWELLRERHHAILDRAMQGHGGHLFQIVGDGFCVAFATAGDALLAAVEAQRMLQQEAWDPAPVKVRMGIHTGTAQAGRTDAISGGYKGYTALARVQRVMSAAHAGQILLSNSSAEMVRGELREAITLPDKKEHRLKGLLNLERLWQAEAEGLPKEFPPLKSLDGIPNNLPLLLTDYIGGDTAIAEVETALENHRLVTLTGPGGTGKTRLSLQVGADVFDRFGDGVWFVELAPIIDEKLVPQALADAFGVQEQPGRTVREVLVDYVKDKCLLIILDNCEHMLQVCAELTGDMLRVAPNMKVLVSSRERFHLAGETIYQVPSLSFPDPKEMLSIDTLTEYDAVRLFIDRAVAAQPSFKLTNENARALAVICHRLDGIPLAIELAAARVRALSVEGITERLSDRFHLLTGGDRAALPRQQTLRALMDWSYDLLSHPERLLLQRLSVFVGGWTLAASEAIGVGEGIGRLDVLDLLTGLVDKSLVNLSADGSRYGMLETVREYALEKLAASGETESCRQAHLIHFVGLAEEAEEHLIRVDQVEWFDRLETEHDNLRTALAWSLETMQDERALHLAGALGQFWHVRGHYSEGREWLRQALKSGERGSKGALAKASRWAGMLARTQGDYEEAVATLGLSLSMYRELGDRGGMARVLLNQGHLAHGQADYSRAKRYFEESLMLSRENGEEHGTAYALNALGLLAHAQGDIPAAGKHFEDCLALFRELGDKSGMASALLNLGLAAHARGDVARAPELYRESLEIARELGDERGMAICLLNLGYEAFAQGDNVSARGLFEESLTLLRRLGAKRDSAIVMLNLGLVAHAQAEVARAREQYEQSLAMLGELGDKWGIAYALSGLASVMHAEGQKAQSARLQGAARALLEEVGSALERSEQAYYDQTAAALLETLGEEAYREALQAGKSLSILQATEIALRKA